MSDIEIKPEFKQPEEPQSEVLSAELFPDGRIKFNIPKNIIVAKYLHDFLSRNIDQMVGIYIAEKYRSRIQKPNLIGSIKQVLSKKGAIR